MTPAELVLIRQRDLNTGEVWFKGPENFTAMAARDRRALLEAVDSAHRELIKAFNAKRTLRDRCRNAGLGYSFLYED